MIRFRRKSLFAGKVEAAGIEPACDSPPKEPLSREKRCSICLGYSKGGDCPRCSPPLDGNSTRVRTGPIEGAVDLGIAGTLSVRQGYLSWYSRTPRGSDAWGIPLEDAIPKLEFILGLAKLHYAQEAH